jgi:hypothetical protein
MSENERERKRANEIKWKNNYNNGFYKLQAT